MNPFNFGFSSYQFDAYLVMMHVIFSSFISQCPKANI